MASFEARVMQRLTDIERRLALMEARRGLPVAPPALEPPPQPSAPPTMPAASAVVDSITAPPPTSLAGSSVSSRKVEALRSLLHPQPEPALSSDTGFAMPLPQPEAPPLSEPPIVQPPPAAVGATPLTSPAIPPIAPPIAAPPTVVPPTRAGTAAPAQPRNLESLIGGRWFAVGGALLILVALALFLRLAYTNGYFDRMSGGMKCSIGAFFGLLLLAGGEVARRKINAWASVGLSSAGVAGVYISVLAAYGTYNLLSNTVAFLLLAATSALGIAVAARSRLAVVAIVSIVGAYAAPLFLQSTNANPLVFPTYLIAILATGLVLSAWLRAGFRIVGSLVWWGTLFFGSIWALKSGSGHPVIALAMLAGAWAMVHAAHFFATRPEPITSDEAEPRRWKAPTIHETWMIASSFTFTTWAVGLSVWTLRQTSLVTIPEWLPPFGFAGITCLLAMTLAGRLRLLTDIPTTGRERLGAALLTQTGALIIAGTALLATGNAAMLVWLSVGLAAVVAGRWIHSRGLDIYGVTVMAIGAGRWLFYESWASGMTAPWREFYGLVFSQWFLFGAITASAWTAAAIALLFNLPATDRPRHRPLAVVAMAVGIAVLMAAFVHQDAVGTSIAIAWLGIGAAAVACGRFGRRLLLDELGMIVLVLAAARLILIDSITGGLSARGSTALGLVATPWMLACLLAGAVWLLIAIVLPPRLQSRGAAESVAVWIGRAAAGLALFMSILAAINQHALGTSIALAWITIGLVAVIAAPLRPRLGLGVMGVAILVIAAARLIVVDGLADLPRDGLAWSGLLLTRWTLAMSLAAAAWLTAGIIISFRPAENPLTKRLPAVASAAAIGLLMLGVYHPDAQSTSVLWVWIAITAIALAASHLRRALRVDHWSGVAALICVLMWLVTHGAQTRFDWTTSDATLLLHPGLLTAFAIAAILLGVAFWGLRASADLESAVIQRAAVIIAVTLIWGATTLEAARIGAALTGDRMVRLATISIWWSLFAVALIVVGFIKSQPLARRAGLSLMAVAGVKVVLFDLGGVPQVWRIASFLLLGLLMLGIAIGYSRISGKLVQKP